MKNLAMKKTVLENGVRVLCVPRKGLKAVTIKVFVKMGSKYEKRGEFGMSHFLEHMAFKGTIKRPKPWDITREIDAKGAWYNASTGQELTSYYITTVREYADWAVEMLADVLLNATYKADEVKKERGVVIEEIKMYEDNPMIGLSDEYAQFLYGGQEVGCFSISGGVKDIASVERKDVMRYRKKYFDPDEMVIVAIGDVGEKVIDKIKECFGGFEKKGKGSLPKVKVMLNRNKTKVKQKEVEQGHFCVGVPGLSWLDEGRYALKLVEVILAGNSSSRLFRKIREEKGWAYYVSGVGQKYREMGFVVVQAGVRMDRLDEAMELVEKEMLSLVKNLRLEELEAAKEFIWGRTKLAMDSTAFWANLLGRNLLLEGKIMNVDEERRKHMKVKLGEARKLAGKLFLETRVRKLVVRGKKI